MAEALCPGCWTTLAALCLIGRDDRYCAAFAEYDATHDSGVLDRVLAMAPPDLIAQAKARAAALGVITIPEARREGTADGPVV